MVEKKRADLLLVERGLAESREKARALILAGEVFLENRKIEKAGELLPVDAPLRVRERLPYVSRGGLKLQKALDHFNIDVRDKVVIDAGASTGGFTDLLLQRGARLVYAVDVGRGQLHWKLQKDPRVVVMDNTNIRYVTREHFQIPPVMATLDLSFISLTLVLPVIYGILEGRKEIVVLIKPQFEVGREKVGKGGVVRKREYQMEAVEKILNFARNLGLVIEGWVESPIKGQKGNVEFLAYFHI